MILFNNNLVNKLPVNKSLFEYGNEVVWVEGKFFEIFKIKRIIKQLHKEGTVENDYLVIQSLSFNNSILLELVSFILKRCDIRIFSLIDLSKKLPYTKCDLERLMNESYD
jgi:hypothetical protein